MLKRLAAACACALCLAATADIRWFRQDFEDPALAVQPSGALPSCGSWSGLDAPHGVLIDAAGHGKALKLTRSEGHHHSFDFKGEGTVPAGHDYRVAFDVKLDAAESFYCTILDAKGGRLAGVLLKQGTVVKTSPDMQSWQGCGIEPPDGWFRLEIAVDTLDSTYTVGITDAEGHHQDGTPAVLMGKGAPALFHFGTVMPEGTSAQVDNIEFTYAKYTPTAGRNELVGDAVAKRDGDATLLELKALAEASTLRVDSVEVPVTVQGLNAMGQWQLLCQEAVPDDEGVIQIDFAPVSLRALKVQGVTTKTPQVRLYAPPSISRHDANAQFQAFVSGEFYLPVYEGVIADLHLFSTAEEDIPVTVTLNGRGWGAQEYDRQAVVLHPGENVVNFKLQNLPDGDFVAVVKEDGPRRGMLRRLLRYQHPCPQLRCPDGTDMRGRKLFFPDGYYLAQNKGITYHSGTGEQYQASKDHTTPGNVGQMAERIGLLNGRLAVAYSTNDGYFHTDSIRNYYTFANLDDLGHWMEPVEGRLPDGCAHPGNPIAQPGRQGDHTPKPGPDGKVRYRLYDAARDGAPDVSQVEIKYVPWMPEGTSLGSAMPQWEGVTPVRRNTWPIWHKAPGESFILTKEALFTDGISGDEFEGPRDSNDNFAGQWLSDDGKTLFYARGRLLRRFAPYNVPFDNGRGIVRMLTVCRTTDGIHYDRRAMAIPDHADPPGTQHYGARVFHVGDSGPLNAAFIMKYYARDQRIALELAYSWDGFHWQRFGGQPILADNGGHNDWNAGYIGSPSDGITYGGKTYLLLGWVADVYHLIAELLWNNPDQATMSTEAVRQYYEKSRPIEQWPLFKRFKDWEEVADRLRKARTNTGVLVLREDGYFYAEGGPDGGSFTTVPLRLAGTLTLNAAVAGGGSLALRVVRPDGTVAAQGHFDGDAVNAPVVTDLPDGLYTLHVTLKDAKLYTIGCL